MDSRIKALPSTTFQGRRFKRKTIQTIKETVELLPGNSRSELALTICEHLNWRSAKGTLARTACLRMLERLEKLDILTLPPKRLNMQTDHSKARRRQGAGDRSGATGHRRHPRTRTHRA